MKLPEEVRIKAKYQSVASRGLVMAGKLPNLGYP
jgi:hypothetical protein